MKRSDIIKKVIGKPLYDSLDENGRKACDILIGYRYPSLLHCMSKKESVVDRARRVSVIISEAATRLTNVTWDTILSSRMRDTLYLRYSMFAIASECNQLASDSIVAQTFLNTKGKGVNRFKILYARTHIHELLVYDDFKGIYNDLLNEIRKDEDSYDYLFNHTNDESYEDGEV